MLTDSDAALNILLEESYFFNQIKNKLLMFIEFSESHSDRHRIVLKFNRALFDQGVNNQRNVIWLFKEIELYSIFFRTGFIYFKYNKFSRIIFLRPLLNLFWVSWCLDKFIVPFFEIRKLNHNHVLLVDSELLKVNDTRFVITLIVHKHRIDVQILSCFRMILI